MEILDLCYKELFKNKDKSIAYPLIERAYYPWEIIPKIKEYILELEPFLSKEKYEKVGESVYIAKSARVAGNAYIGDFTIIDEGAEIRQGAFIRGSAIIGKNTVVGNSTEIKNSILFDYSQVPHYNYVGDSILGYRAHFGAGAITSNVKGDKGIVKIVYKGDKIDTGLRKLGALVGDFCEIGCNAVLNPGTVLGWNTQIYPLSLVRGYIEGNSIFKSPTRIVKRENPIQ